MTKIDSTYAYWFPIGIIGVASLLYLKSPNLGLEIIIYILSIFLIITSSIKLYKIYTISRWQTIDANVTNVAYEEWYAVDRWLKVKNFRPLLTYSYQINNKKSSSNVIGLFDVSYAETTEQDGKEKINKFLKKYAVGTSIQIYIHPKKSNISLLYNTVHWSVIAKHILINLVGIITLFGINI